MSWGLAAALAAALGAQPAPTVEIIHRGDAPFFGRAAFSHYAFDTDGLFAGVTAVHRENEGLPVQRDEAFVGGAYRRAATETVVAAKLSATAGMVAASHTTEHFEGMLNLERTTATDPFLQGSRWYGSGTLRTEHLLIMIMGGDDATPELTRSARQIGKPIEEESLLGHRAIFDAPLHARTPESYMGVAFAIFDGKSGAGLGIRDGTTRDYSGDMIPFEEVDLTLAHQGARVQANLDVTLQEQHSYADEYSSRITAEACGRLGGTWLCSGAYIRGTHPSLGGTITAASARGGAIEVRRRIAQGTGTTFGLYDYHIGRNERVTRIGTSYEPASGRLARATIELREDAKSERREFKTESELSYRAGMELRITGKLNASFEYQHRTDGQACWDISMKVRR